MTYRLSSLMSKLDRIERAREQVHGREMDATERNARMAYLLDRAMRKAESGEPPESPREHRMMEILALCKARAAAASAQVRP